MILEIDNFSIHKVRYNSKLGRSLVIRKSIFGYEYNEDYNCHFMHEKYFYSSFSRLETIVNIRKNSIRIEIYGIIRIFES